MIDVTFLILIFFMVTASFSLQRAIETPTPVSDSPSRSAVVQQPVENLRLHVGEFGDFLLMANDWQREIVGKQALITQLSETLANHAARTSTDHVTLRIEVESDAKLQSLVDAVDAASLAGFSEYQLAQVDTPLI